MFKKLLPVSLILITCAAAASGASSTPASYSPAATPAAPAAASSQGGAPASAGSAPSGGAPLAPTAPTGKPGGAPTAGTGKPGGAGAPPGKGGRAAGKGGSSLADIPVARFSASDLSGWTDKSIKGKVSYTLEDGALKAHSVKAASGKVKKLSLDARKYPRLTWSWKIDHTLKHEDIAKKSGDDFAARVYVLFPRTFFWRMRAINYVWSAKMPKGSEVASPYTKNSAIIAVESGDEKAGKWVTEERNVYEDYRKFFGEEPPLMGGIAIMTDTDDTQDEATAWYGDITLHAAP